METLNGAESPGSSDEYSSTRAARQKGAAGHLAHLSFTGKIAVCIQKRNALSATPLQAAGARQCMAQFDGS